MNLPTKACLGAGAFLVLSGGLLALTGFLMGGDASLGWSGQRGAVEGASSTPSAETAGALAPFAALNVDLARGSVSVVAAGEDYEISVTGRLAEEVSYELTGDTLTVTGGGEGLEFFSSGDEALVMVTVPEGAYLESADLNADMGQVEVDGITAAALQVSSGLGNVDLSDVTVLTYGGVLKVGDIASGESRRITAGELSFGPTGMPYITGNYIMDVEESSSNRQAAEYMSDLAGSGLIEYYMENSLGSYFPGAVIIGFSEGRQAPESIVSGEMSCYGTTLLATDADADFGRSSEIYRIALAEEPKLISGEYNLYDNTTKGNAAVVLEYSLGTDVNVTGLKLNSLSEEFEGMADNLVTVTTTK